MTIDARPIKPIKRINRLHPRAGYDYLPISQRPPRPPTKIGLFAHWAGVDPRLHHLASWRMHPDMWEVIVNDPDLNGPGLANVAPRRTHGPRRTLIGWPVTLDDSLPRHCYEITLRIEPLQKSDPADV